MGYFNGVGVLLVLDSRLAERLSLAKDVFSMLPFAKDKDKPEKKKSKAPDAAERDKRTF